MAEEAGLSVDRAAFDTLMTEQRTRAKADAKSKKKVLADLSVYGDFRAKGETVFTGYTDLATESSVLGIIVDGAPVEPRDRRATSPRSSSPRPRSTPSPAGRRPTRAASSAPASSSRCSTCRSPSRA